MNMAWLSDKQPGSPAPWRWPRRRRIVAVHRDDVFARAEQALAIAERLRVSATDPVVAAEIGALHTLARDLLRWTR